MRFFAARITKSFRRGSALLLALVLTIALFIMGLVFVSTTQIEKETVSRVDELQTLDTAVDTVIDRINNVLVDDLIYKPPGLGDEMLDGQGDSQGNTEKNEYYDYPGPDDPWLASLEPMFFWDNGTPADDTDDWYAWRHISDIYDNNFGVPAAPVYYDPDDESVNTQWALGSFFLVSPYNLIAKIISSDDRVSVIEESTPIWDEDYLWYSGARADADGDGVADSRWVKVPNLTGPRGQNVYTAVRIIDNGGMLNLNTGLTFDPAVANGSCLTDIDLTGICRSTGTNPDNPAYLHAYRCVFDIDDLPTVFPTRSEYDFEVSKRTLNPLVPSTVVGVAYNLYDITDELELRNRFFIDSQVISRTEYLWPKTFAGGNGLTKTVPYNDPTDLPKWFQKAYFDTSVPDLYTRRHICTTYNFDRVMIAKPDYSIMPGDLTIEWNKWTYWNDTDKSKWTYRPICVNDLLDGGATPTDEQIKQLAAAIWLGLPKNADLITNDQMVELNWVGTDERERLACQLAVNIIDYIDTDHDITKLTVNSNDYYGYESQWGNVFITRVGVTKYDPAPPGNAIIRHYAIVLHNPGPEDVSLDGWNIYNQTQDTTYNLDGLIIVQNRVLVLIDGDDPSGWGFKASEFTEPVEVVNGILFSDDDVLVLRDNQGRPSDKVTVKNITIANVSAVDTRDVLHSDNRTGDKYIGFDPSKIYVWGGDLTSSGVPRTDVSVLETFSTLPATKVTADIQTNTLAFGEIKNVAELHKSLMIGAMKFSNDYVTMSECWDKFIQADVATDISAEDIHKGRPDAADPAFVDLARYLTVFHPFSDDIDNDGNGLSDDPLKDKVDNDRDGSTDEADETFANNCGEKSELAVAGRININTAPWFVIAQLPWVQDPGLSSTTSPDKENKVKLAQAIVAYRDKTAWDVLDYSTSTWAAPDNVKTRKHGMGLQSTDMDIREEIGFANITELINVTHNLKTGSPGSITYDEHYDIRRYGRDDNAGVPKNNNELVPHDPDPGPFFDEDNAANDLKERDVIFQRISNLVTVRSDVFTAYIMVRVGELGPQKRVIAIFDRSNVYKSGDTPKLVALHPVPDPR